MPARPRPATPPLIAVVAAVASAMMLGISSVADQSPGLQTLDPAHRFLTASI
jgi:hypothetical protein